MRKEMIKTLVIGMMLLLVGIAFQPVVSTNELKIERIKPEQYLFETIEDAVDEPEINDYLEQIGNGLINYNINVRSAFLEIVLKNPRLITSVFFNLPAKNYNYLEKTYSLGIDTVKIIGEDRSIEIFNAFKEKNLEILDDLQIILLNDEELNERIGELESLNNLPKSDFPFATNPIICSIFTTLTVFFVIDAVTLYNLATAFLENSPIYDIILTYLVGPLMDIALVNAAIADMFGCWADWPGI
jgi:hypothetical protein